MSNNIIEYGRYMAIRYFVGESLRFLFLFLWNLVG